MPNGKKLMAAGGILLCLCMVLLSCKKLTNREEPSTETFWDTELSDIYGYYRDAMSLLTDKLPVTEETAAGILRTLVENGMTERLNYCVRVTDYESGEKFYRLWWQDGEASLYLTEKGEVSGLLYQGTDLYHETAEKETASPAESTDTATEETVYVLNTATKKFHLPTCRYAKKPEDDKYEAVKTREEAVEKGCEPCKVCNP